MKRAEFHLFSTPQVKTISWTTSGVTSFKLKVGNRELSSSLNGTIQFSDPGSHSITYEAVLGNSLGGVNISVDGSVVVNVNNESVQTVKTPVACAEYVLGSGSSARGEDCREGYSKDSYELYRRCQLIVEGGQFRNQCTDWSRTRLPDIAGSIVGGQDRRDSTTSIRTVYFCRPNRGCQDSTSAVTKTYARSLSSSFTVSNERAAVPQRPPQPQPGVTGGPGVSGEEVEGIVEKAVEKITSRIGQQSIADIPPGQSQDTKYRIISPLVYETRNGVQVPQMRYESVRLLSPEAVSSFVIRGYEVEMVNPYTPLSYSKPYGKSVLARAQAVENIKIIQSHIPPGRQSIQDLQRIAKRVAHQPTIVKRRGHTRISE